MDDRLAIHIAEVINWHRTWLMVLDFGTYSPVISKSPRATRKTLEPTFRLEVRVGMYGYRRGAVIAVSYTQIAGAISTLAAADPELKKRLTDLSLTYHDINRIFKLATWDAIDLDLEE